MSEKNTLLLPSGLYDLLPPEARKESAAVARLLASFESFGYAQVSPPLMEFEASLLAGRGEALARQTFRVMDSLSQGMMGFRADITMQVSRIARSRMGGVPRPLRLSYAGPILQTRAEALKNERQLTQAGIECIGGAALASDSEVMVVAAESLLSLGISDISIDVNLPGLLFELCPEVGNNAELQAQVKDAVLHKEPSKIAKLPVKNSALLASLCEAAGPMDKALAALQKLKLPQIEPLSEVTNAFRRTCPSVSLTLDPIEYRGFDYHEGISFSIFARGLRHELGRGGRYVADGESATGFTLYVTHLLRLLPAPEEKNRVLTGQEVASDTARALREQGWVTIYAAGAATPEEAKRMDCGYILKADKPEKL